MIIRFSVMLMCISGSLFGQELKWHFDATSHVGIVIRHTNKIGIGSGVAIPGTELGLHRNTHGQSGWERYYHAPQYGLVALWFRPGSNAHGHAISLMPCLTIPFSQQQKSGMIFRIGTGIGLVTKPYHFLHNPDQNAIGTRWNNTVQFRFGWRQELKHLWWQAGAAFTHFSNGGTAQPNFGINMPSAYLTCGLQTGKLLPLPKQQNTEPIMPKRWGWSLHTWASRIRYHIVYDGPKYPVYGLNAALYYRTHRYNRFYFGADMERNEAVYQWFMHATGGADAVQVRRGSNRLAAFAANEFLFAQFGIYMQAGYYIGDRRNAWTLSSYYNKLGLRYYLPAWKKARIRPVIGMQLKAHKAIAEYIGFGIGLESMGKLGDRFF